MLLGHFHPLVIHLPIGLLIGVAWLEVIRPRARGDARGAHGALLQLAAAGALAAVATGWRLGLEDGRTGDTFRCHRALGFATLALTVLTWIAHKQSRGATHAGWLGAYRWLLAVSLACMGYGAHLGGTLTHGPGYLAEALGWAKQSSPRNLQAPKAAVLPDAPTEPSTYAAAVAPILAARCASCHGEKRQKGDLALHSMEALIAGGESGPVIVPSDAKASALIGRMRLALDDDDHMPPKDKPQPTEQEIELLERWIQAGAPFTGQVSGIEPLPLPKESSPDPVGAATTEKQGPSAELLARLARDLVHAQAPADEPGAWWLDFSAVAASATDRELGAWLDSMRAFVVEVNLSRSQAGPLALEACRQAPLLLRLDLRAAPSAVPHLALLAGHPALEELNLARTGAGDAALVLLLSLPRLERAILWEAGLTKEGLEQLRAERPELTIVTGDEAPAAALESEGEIALSGDAPVLSAGAAQRSDLSPINKLCPVSGQPIDARYVIVSEGRAIGFCCEKCPASYWADPAAYADKLP